MLSSNLLKSKIPMGGVTENYAEFKFAKIPKFPFCVGVGGVGGKVGFMEI